MKRILEKHCCQKTTFYKEEKKPKHGKKCNPSKENNHLVYVFDDDNNSTTMYCLTEKINDDQFLCHIQGKFSVKMPLVPEYDWSHVGVYKIGPTSDEQTVINIKDISGKVLKVDNYLITCPLNVLHEQ